MFYEISAYNTQALYAWASNVADVERYVDWLNRNREINVYGYAEIEDAEKIARIQDECMSMDEPHWDDFMDEDQ